MLKLHTLGLELHILCRTARWEKPWTHGCLKGLVNLILRLEYMCWCSHQKSWADYSWCICPIYNNFCGLTQFNLSTRATSAAIGRNCHFNYLFNNSAKLSPAWLNGPLFKLESAGSAPHGPRAVRPVLGSKSQLIASWDAALCVRAGSVNWKIQKVSIFYHRNRNLRWLYSD